MAAGNGRKGARTRDGVSPAILAALNAGTEQTASLSEMLAMDFSALLRRICPAADIRPLTEAGLGVTKRMERAAAILSAIPDLSIESLSGHPSDTVRGWACYMIGRNAELNLEQRLQGLRPLAEDDHFGVREWAWLAVRPAIIEQPQRAIAALSSWVGEASAGLRRFASEATRPRGVWCAHIPALRADPRPGLDILFPLRADPDRYVQNSIGNWLNDAAKDHPGWVHEVCGQWGKEKTSPATRYIIKRACRNLI